MIGCDISVVSPVYKAEDCLLELYSRLKSSLEKITSNFEIILVNDGSLGNDWKVICQISRMDPRVKGINLSRNFGQHYAITAGLDHCRGEWIVVMDCDLQDQPEEIINLYAKANSERFDLVLGKRTEREDSFSKIVSSRIFYGILGYLTDTKQDSSIANFGIYNRQVIKMILEMKDSIRYFPAMVRWVGFRSTSISVKHSARYSGQTSYSLKKLIKLGIDVILSFSDKPLRLTIKIGFFISLLSFIYAIYNLFLYFNNRIVVPGFASLIISVWFLSGLMISILGIVGLYIGRIFDKVKNRPLYIISDKTSSNEQ
jgi:glycosyltransferase involved in cell wall biosynthesis